MNGWLKLHRELFDKAIWKTSTPEQKTILITLLAMANFKQKQWEWRGEIFKCEPGQFITSLESIANESGKNITIQNVRTALTKFEKYGFLTNLSTKSGRLVTIVNWEFYQSDEQPTNIPTNKELTKSQQRANKELTPNEEGKNDKKERKEYTCAFEEFWKSYPRRVDKGNAYKAWMARLGAGYAENDIIKAAESYAAECRREQTEAKYIKHPKTFLSASTPFLDYLNKEVPKGEQRNPLFTGDL